MYLMAWSSALWRPSSVPWHTYELAGDQGLGRVYSPATRRAVQFGEGLAYARRVLANVPTYMAFDDHEVTDDWNLNHEDWSSGVNGTRWGGRSCATRWRLRGVPGLGQPARRLPPGNPRRRAPGAAHQQHLGGAGRRAAARPRRGGRDPRHRRDPGGRGSGGPPQAVALHRPRARARGARPGHAHLEGVPRPRFPRLWEATEDIVDIWELEEIGKQLSAGLVSSEALELRLQQLTDAMVVDLDPPEVRQPMIVSPAPVLGMWFVETLQRLAILRDLVTGDPVHAGETWDNKPWAGNGDAYVELLDRLTAKSPVMFLSGDVHYAFSQVGLRLRVGLARFIQLVRARPGTPSTAPISCRSPSSSSPGPGLLRHPLRDPAGSPSLEGDLAQLVDAVRSFDPWGELRDMADEAWETWAARGGAARRPETVRPARVRRAGDPR